MGGDIASTDHDFDDDIKEYSWTHQPKVDHFLSPLRPDHSIGGKVLCWR